MAGGSRFRVTPAAAPEQPEIKQLQNALLVPPRLPNLSSDQLPKDTHQVSGLSGSVCCTPSLVVCESAPNIRDWGSLEYGDWDRSK